MPVNRLSATNLDKYYTRRDIPAECRAIFMRHISKNTVVVEPSAGAGAFLTDEISGFDLTPEHPAIGALDFLTAWLPPDHNGRSVGETETGMAFLGNPPFGKRAALAIAFINRAFMYTQIVGFIVPVQLRKWSAQRRVMSGAKLIVDHDLPDDAFTLMDEPYAVRCCFQIWSRDRSAEDLRLTERLPISHPDFEMKQHNGSQASRRYLTGDWDIAVLGQGHGDYGVIHERGAVLNPRKHWMMLRANGAALTRLRLIDLAALARGNTSTPGFRIGDLVKAYRARFE